MITGAGRGIGRATALLFSEQGAICVLASRTESELKSLAAEIESKGGKALPVVCDVSKEEDLDRLVSETVQAFGRIDILVNNAGGGARNEVVHAQISDWDQMLNINLRGAIICAKKVVTQMIKQKSGVIINISSVAGLYGFPKSSVYCATKFGLRGFSKALFQEVREEGIKVSTICPGYVDTPLIPQNRKVDRTKMMSPQDIARACLFVATSSPQACPTELVMVPQQDPQRGGA